jgi:hypothetical protein
VTYTLSDLIAAGVFGALAAVAAEREACGKAVEIERDVHQRLGMGAAAASAYDSCLRAIRARGDQ